MGKCDITRLPEVENKQQEMLLFCLERQEAQIMII